VRCIHAIDGCMFEGRTFEVSCLFCGAPDAAPALLYAPFSNRIAPSCMVPSLRWPLFLWSQACFGTTKYCNAWLKNMVRPLFLPAASLLVSCLVLSPCPLLPPVFLESMRCFLDCRVPASTLCLRVQVCPNPDCLYLHEVGTQEDSFTKEEMLHRYNTAAATAGGSVTSLGPGINPASRVRSPAFVPWPLLSILLERGGGSIYSRCRLQCLIA